MANFVNYGNAETLMSEIAEKLRNVGAIMDNAFSDSSTNGVQNKVIKSALDTIDTALSGKSDTGHKHSAADITISGSSQSVVDKIAEVEDDVAGLKTGNKRTQAACTNVRIKGTAVYARKRNGVVTINGATQLSENLARNNWIEILTIPTGYRPANYEYGTAIIDTGTSGGIACPVDISANGSLRVFTYGLSISEDTDLANKYIFISATYTTTY